jgi:hypothetical protein
MGFRLSRNLLVAAIAVGLLGQAIAERARTPRAGAGSKGVKRVLFLGDSMSMGAFGRTFDEMLRAAGFEVYTCVAGGATPYYWLSRYETIASDIGFWKKTPSGEQRQRTVKAVPKVESLIKLYNPDVVVVQTGTNLYSSLRSKRRSKAGNVKEVEGLCRNMAEAVTRGGRRCYWITPPAAHSGRYPVSLQTELTSLTQRVVGRYGRVFDSRKVTKYVDPYPKNDGIHYGPTEARQWAKHVVADFVNYTGGEAVGRRALEPNEVFGTKVAEVKRATPVDPDEVAWGAIDVKLRLKSKTILPKKSAVTYRSCCVLYEYEVLDVEGGYYPYDTLRVAHLGVFNRKVTAKARYPVGTVRSWKMAPIERYSYFLRLQMADDLEVDLDKPIYVIKQD